MPSSPHRTRLALISLAALLFFCFGTAALAHPLGNFTINHFSRLEVGSERVRVRYVVDLAEIPAFQAMQTMDADGDGMTSAAEFDAYAARAVAEYAAALTVTLDGARIPLETISKSVTTPEGAGGLKTLRVECEFVGQFPSSEQARARRLRFEDANYSNRIGWREIVVTPADGVAVFDSTAFGTALTDELKAYPQDMLASPPDERAAELSFTRGALPAGAAALRSRDGVALTSARDTFAELIAVRDLTLWGALLGLLIAAALGALHALSPGHGKTVVGAYLVGSRGTAKHAVFLGLTVTVTHTAGVFALGLVTLFASQYVVPEQLFPVLSLVSGGIVVVIGLSLFIRRLRAALGLSKARHSHDGHSHGEHEHDHSENSSHTHSHGGRAHSHLPPGADGGAVTWRSLLALGISGGLLPCPSALVVLLSAIALHRVGYGMLLVVAFSLGLASTLTLIGLAFVYAGRWMKNLAVGGRLVRVLPAVSALVVTCVGLVICYQALAQAGINPLAFLNHLRAGGEPQFASVGALAILGLGLVFGLKHATEVDHVIAVSTIVSEHRSFLRAALVGGVWGVGHTISLVLVGIVVLALRVTIPEQVSGWLEFCVALMIIGLGVAAFARALRRRSGVHVHKHQHDGLAHAHVHFHEQDTSHAGPVEPHSHAVRRVGLKPLLVGAMHGLAGSAALTLLVLTQIESAALGLLYLAVFGLGSILGMLLMSGLIALPFVFSARKLTGIHYGLQAAAGVFSIAFGFWYAYETGTASGLF
jgi:nickel/cobalt exporter